MFGKKQPIVIVDPVSTGACFAPKIREFNIPIIAVISGSKALELNKNSYFPDDFEQVLFAENTPLLVEQLQNLKPRYILVGCETGVELADDLSTKITPQFANDPEKAKARVDKGKMATVVFENGLDIIPQICTDSAEEVQKWIVTKDLLHTDLVVKPAKSSGTDGVVKIPKGKNWQKVFTEMLGTYNRLGILNTSLVVQEFVLGTEFVVDTASYEGKHSICDICQYFKVENDSYMAIYEKMEWCSPNINVYDELVNYARGVLDAIGMKFGTAHIEIMMTNKGPRLVEVGSRPHGGGHAKFNKIATGDSQIDRLVDFFEEARDVPESFELSNHVTVIFLINKTEGIVSNVKALDKFKYLTSHLFSTVNIKDGDFLKVTKDLHDTFNLGIVVLSHKNKAQVLKDYYKVQDIENELNIAQV